MRLDVQRGARFVKNVVDVIYKNVEKKWTEVAALFYTGIGDNWVRKLTIIFDDIARVAVHTFN